MKAQAEFSRLDGKADCQWIKTTVWHEVGRDRVSLKIKPCCPTCGQWHQTAVSSYFGHKSAACAPGGI